VLAEGAPEELGQAVAGLRWLLESGSVGLVPRAPLAWIAPPREGGCVSFEKRRLVRVTLGRSDMKRPSRAVKHALSRQPAIPSGRWAAAKVDLTARSELRSARKPSTMTVGQNLTEADAPHVERRSDTPDRDAPHSRAPDPCEADHHLPSVYVDRRNAPLD
jgi:hypothetical protein